VDFLSGPVSFGVFSGNHHCVTEADFQRIFNEHKDTVYRFAWRMTSSAAVAEDIAQDVFLSVFRQPNRFDPSRGTMRAFLLGIARNIALKRWRDEARWEELGDDESVTQPMNVEHIERAEIAEAVGNAVRSLPPLQREVLILSEYEDLSLEEIARAVEAEVGTVKSRLHRARENLKQMLAPLRSVKSENEVRPAKHGTIK
jgi:RNA polymerase sigma-70 factor (ECF subfamily)